MTAKTLRALERAAMRWYRYKGPRYDLYEWRLSQACAAHAQRKRPYDSAQSLAQRIRAQRKGAKRKGR